MVDQKKNTEPEKTTEQAKQFQEDYAKKVQMIRQAKGDAKAGIDGMIAELEFHLNACPMGPKFLGKNVKYEAATGWFTKKKELNLMPFKQGLQDPDKKRVSNVRSELEATLKKHPDNAELHALRAIQVYQDINQAGIRTDKLGAMKNCITEMAVAICNGADQVTYSIWFVNMYVGYLEYLKDRINRITRTAQHVPNKRVIELRRILKARMSQLAFFQGVRDKLMGVTRLATLLKGTIYVNESITSMEVKQAASMLLKGNELQNIKDTKKKASHVLYIYFTLSLLYANIPILKEKVKENLVVMPEIHRDIILQKRMIISVDGINEFKAELYSGHNKEAKSSALKLLKFFQDTIKEHLDTSILTKQFEIDPFIKIAWIILEARDLFPMADLTTMLNMAREGLEVLFSKRCQLKGAEDQARDLYNALTDLELNEESRKRDIAFQNRTEEAEAAAAESADEDGSFDGESQMPVSLR